MKCPLSLPEADLLPENLDAAVARGRASVFGSLPYSPTELETVRLVAEKITEASRLGFEQVEIPDTRLSDQFTKTLTDKGFHVRERNTAEHSSLYERTSFSWGGPTYPADTAYFNILSTTTISWAEEAPPEERPFQEVLKEAQEKSSKRQAEFDEEFKGRLERVLESQAARQKQISDIKDEPSPPRSGCLAILLIPLGLIAAIITTNI